MQWDIAYMQLEKAETTFEAAELLERPEHNLRCCGCTGDQSGQQQVEHESMHDQVHDQLIVKPCAPAHVSHMHARLCSCAMILPERDKIKTSGRELANRVLLTLRADMCVKSEQR